MAEPDVWDLLIVGAGLSGIGLGYYLGRDLPTLRYQILEARESLGGTWDLFRYPGIRSDSDLYTFGYEFKPWTSEKSIADGASILQYLKDTASEFGIDRHIQYQTKVLSASFDSTEALWTVELEHAGIRSIKKAKWIFSAAGYYNYEQGYTPNIPGLDRFKGRVIHPQHWPEDADFTGKRIVVIGSGATAVTLVPALASKAQHVTMLQRTPTYILSQPAVDKVAQGVRKLLPERLAHRVIRQKNIRLSRFIWRFCMRYPKAAKNIIQKGIQKQLKADVAVEKHFNPPYNPWQQRLCLVPNGNLFKALNRGKAAVVTDEIEGFDESEVVLKSGARIQADWVITATGLNLQTFGGVQLFVDQKLVEPNDCVAFKGMMLSDVPNMAFAIGYTNASWTLKVGLLCEHLCRLLSYMDQHGFKHVRPKLPSPNMPTRALLDFGAGYVKRSLDRLPRQGFDEPWLMSMDYLKDVKTLRKGVVADPNLEFR